MYPTLIDGDLLELCTNETDPHIGDVILFSPPGLNTPVVHRIIGYTNGKFSTRGDNCSHIDLEQITRENIHGKVICATRGQKDLKIAGSLMGRLQAGWCRIRNVLRPKLAWCIRLFFERLKFLSSSCYIAPAQIQYRAVRFENKGNPAHRLMFGKKNIGYYDIESEKWNIRFPYRLLANQNSLPRV